jgi:hypothetical protein
MGATWVMGRSQLKVPLQCMVFAKEVKTHGRQAL